MTHKKLFAALIVAIMIVLLLPLGAYADSEKAVNAEIMQVYGGADGIISMTFDDGYYDTALVLDELFEKYDLKGSIMMIAQNATGSAGKFKPLFDTGRLEPQSHSMTHSNLSDGKVPLDRELEIYQNELADSRTLLENIFPQNDIITFAIPHGTMSANATEFASKHYYAIRTTKNGVQTLDPESNSDFGGWYAMYSPTTYKQSFDSAADPAAAQWEWIKKCIDDAANGWYVPITHKVGDVAGTELPYKVADKMFEYIASLRDEGKVWVTTYSEAVKYVRERQNSALRAYSVDGSIFVDISMTDTTEDGLPIDADVFNTPLTVKIEVPAEYGTVYYTNVGKEYTAEAFSDGSKNYIYANITPNSGAVKLRLDSTHDFAQWDKHDDQLHTRTCIDCGLVDYGEHVWDEGEIIKAPTHTKTGIKKCTCLLCGDLQEFKVNKKTEDHTFDKKVESMNFKASDATCLRGETYYYSCVCGEVGAETYEVGEPLGHTFGEWTVLEEATEAADGVAVRKCACGEAEYEVIPEKAGKPGISTPVLIGIISSAVVLLLGLGFMVMFIVFKKRKS